MAHYEGSYLILDEGESASFRERALHPDPEAIRRRDRLFAEIDQMNIIRNADGSMEVPFTPKRRPMTKSQKTGDSNVLDQKTEEGDRLSFRLPISTEWVNGDMTLTAA